MVLGGTAIKPKERHGWERVRYIIHNPETGEILSRTPKSWALITVFYLIYYTCLTGFWLAMLNIFFLTLTDHKPKWIADDGLIGASPGLGLKPTQVDELIDSSMIAYNKDSEKDAQGKPGDANYVAGYQGWEDRIDDFLKTYTGNKTHPACTGEKCFDVSQLGACGVKPYGYKEGKPCVYLKLNKIYGLNNEIYEEGKPGDAKYVAMPENMPKTLKTHIDGQADKNQVWVECHGEYPADIEGLGAIKYFPEASGFPATYFPYMGKIDANGNALVYQSPLIAVQFENAKPNQLLHVECRAWAKNIGYNKRDRIGINHLELLILDDAAAVNVGS